MRLRSKRTFQAAALGLVAFLLVLLGLRVLANDQAAALAADVQAGKAPLAPRFTLPRLDGRGSLDLSAFRGKVVVLNFWASWCEPCKAEAPVLERVQQRLQKSRAGTVFGVTYKDAPDASRAFIREEKSTWPNVRDDRLKLAPKFGTSQLPETFVIDRTGKVVALSRGQIDQQFMDAALARAGVP